MMKKKNKCCGCGACSQRCPMKCIDMIMDEEGFLYPEIDRTKCIKCGLCESVCPMQRMNNYSEETSKTYIAYNTDSGKREKSSSGGLFYLFAKNILDDNGVVFGATFNDEFEVCHTYIKKENEIIKLMGSKYVQSKIEDMYSNVELFLSQGIKVLFTGTACQISGLISFLKKEYTNLYLVDVLCHGTPSPLVWDLYLEKIKKERWPNIREISFRDKKNGWKDYSVKITFENGEEYCVPYKDDMYMQMFLSEICLRPSCYACKFKELGRDSDITIGDAWGIGSNNPEMDDDKGTSISWVHTKKGQSLFDSVEGKLIYKMVELDDVLPPNANSRKSVTSHLHRKKFMKKLKNKEDFYKLHELIKLNSVEKIIQKGRSGVKKIYRWVFLKIL